MAADTLTALADELDAMPRRAQRAILQALSADERAMLDRRVNSEKTPPAVDPAGNRSPWLAERITHARGGGAGMTAASRQLLLRCVDPEPSRVAAGSGPTTPGVTGRSLFDAVGGMLSPRKGRI